MDRVLVEWMHPGVVEFVYSGAITEEMLDSALRRYQALTRSENPNVHFVDTLGVESIPPTLGKMLGTVLDEFRERGGKHVIMVASDRMNQMLGSSMGFGAGIQVAIFQTRNEAITHLGNLK